MTRCPSKGLGNESDGINIRGVHDQGRVSGGKTKLLPRHSILGDGCPFSQSRNLLVSFALCLGPTVTAHSECLPRGVRLYRSSYHPNGPFFFEKE